MYGEGYMTKANYTIAGYVKRRGIFAISALVF